MNDKNTGTNHISIVSHSYQQQTNRLIDRQGGVQRGRQNRHTNTVVCVAVKLKTFTTRTGIVAMRVVAEVYTAAIFILTFIVIYTHMIQAYTQLDSVYLIASVILLCMIALTKRLLTGVARGLVLVVD